MSQNNQKIQEKKCKEHPQYAIIGVCLEKECENKQKRISCLICLTQYHKQHLKKCEFIQDILEEVNNNNKITKQTNQQNQNDILCTQKNIDINNLQIYKYFIEQQKEYVKKCQKNQNQDIILQNINQNMETFNNKQIIKNIQIKIFLKQKYQNEIVKFKQLLEDLQNLSNSLPQQQQSELLQIFQNTKDTNLIEKELKISFNNNKNLKNKIIEQYQQNLIYIKTLQKIQFDKELLQEKCTNVIDLFSDQAFQDALLYESINKSSFKFHTKFKSDSIILSKQNTIAVQNKQRSHIGEGHRYALLTPSIQSKSTWKIKILKKAAFIGVGVCDLNNLKKRNFSFDYNDSEHGGYMLSSNAYVWHGSDQQQNIKQPLDGFEFKDGDILILKFSKATGTLTIQKQDTKQICKITNIKSSGPVNPVVNLCSNTESVEILQK